MAKRGETRVWRVRFEWENGVKGAETFRDFEAAQTKAEQIREAGERRGMDVWAIVEDRRMVK